MDNGQDNDNQQDLISDQDAQRPIDAANKGRQGVKTAKQINNARKARMAANAARTGPGAGEGGVAAGATAASTEGGAAAAAGTGAGAASTAATAAGTTATTAAASAGTVGGTAAAGAGGVGAGAGIGVGGVVAIVIAIIVLLLIALIAIFGGGASSAQANCATITASSTTTTIDNPAIITLDGCSPNVKFFWEAPTIGGSFEPPDGQSTSYIPPQVTTDTTVTINVKICKADDLTACSNQSIDIIVSPSDSACAIAGGTCTGSSLCGAEGTPISGATGCDTAAGEVCCNFGQDNKFFCQYGAVNSSGKLIGSDYGSWNYTQTQNGRRCEINTAGCAPTSVAMILNSLGYSTNPTLVSKANRRITDPLNINENIGCRGTGPRVGTSWEDIYYSGGVRSWVNNTLPGFTMSTDLVGQTMSNSTLRTIDNAIQRGCLVLAGANVRYAVGAGLVTEYGGHAFMISGVDYNNKSVTAYDPTFCRSPYIGGERQLVNVTTNSRSGPNTVNGWIYVSTVCRN